MKKENKYLMVVLWLVCSFIIFSIFINISYSYSWFSHPEWKKGPLMDESSPYSQQKAPKMFWVCVIIFELLFVFFTFLIHLTRHKKIIRYTKWNFIIVIFLLSTSAFIVVEGGLRWYIKKYSITHFRPHPTLLWRIRPNLRDFVNHIEKERITTNSLGLRGKEVPFRKNSNDFRILALGDSANFGHGVENNETWETCLERMLQEKFPNRNIQVINGACPGYTTYEGLVFLKAIGIRFHPDILIVGFNNDPCKDLMKDKERVSKNVFFRIIKQMLYKSDFYLLFRQTAISIGRAFTFKHTQNAYSDYNDPNYVPDETDRSLVPRVSLNDYEKNIKDFIEIAHKNGIYLIFIKMPINRTAFKLKDRFYDPLYPHKLEKICLESNQTLVDVDSRWFAIEKSPELLFHPGQLQHPNKDGHLKIAQQLYETITQKNLVR